MEKEEGRSGTVGEIMQDNWAEYEPFDRAGLTEWTGVYECDDDDCENRVAVYDPYGTCGIVLCAEHNDGIAAAGPILFAEPDHYEDDEWRDESDPEDEEEPEDQQPEGEADSVLEGDICLGTPMPDLPQAALPPPEEDSSYLRLFDADTYGLGKSTFAQKVADLFTCYICAECGPNPIVETAAYRYGGFEWVTWYWQGLRGEVHIGFCIDQGADLNELRQIKIDNIYYLRDVTDFVNVTQLVEEQVRERSQRCSWWGIFLRWLRLQIYELNSKTRSDRALLNHLRQNHP